MSSKFKNYSYSDCVNRGVDLVADFKSFRYEICLLATRACEIKQGGHSSGGVYSLKKFATDIDLNYLTLKKWMKEHISVVVKLKDIPKSEDQRVVRLVAMKVKKDTPIKEVRRLYKEYSNYDKSDHQVLRCLESAKYIRNFLLDHNVEKLNADKIQELTVILNKSLELLK